MTMTQTDVRTEINRRRSQTAQLLESFKKHGELTTKDLMQIGTGCSSRLHELRSEGHKIVATRDGPGLYRYIYIAQFPVEGDAE
jgi:hypothetical protein